MDFDIENPILVKRLGIFDENSDGIKLPIIARIWNREIPEVVAETQFTSEAPGELVHGVRLKPLAEPLRLAAGFRGVIEVDGYGPEERIRTTAEKFHLDITSTPVIDTPHSHASAAKAVELVRLGQAEALMKGSLHTDEIMGEVVKRGPGTDRETWTFASLLWNGLDRQVRAIQSTDEP